MNTWVGIFAVFAAVRCGVAAETARTPEPLVLSKTADTYFMEDDVVYARFLWFQPSGHYRQINRDRTTSEEVDLGVWEQTAGGEIALHPTNGMLLFRALSAGPLLVMLDTQSRVDSLVTLRNAMVNFLRVYQDSFFARSALSDLGQEKTPEQAGATAPEHAQVVLSEGVDTFERSDLENLLRRIDWWLASKSTNRFLFEPVVQPGLPTLLIQRGAVFSKANLPVAHAKRVVAAAAPAPPFYFARIDRQTFLARAGKWKAFANLGGLHSHVPGGKTLP